MHYNSGFMTRRSTSLDTCVSEAFTEINPRDAQKPGIAQGGKVKVVNKRGEVDVRVEVTNRVAEGIVFIPFHFPEINTLTIDVLDPEAKVAECKVAACRVKRR